MEKVNGGDQELHSESDNNDSIEEQHPETIAKLYKAFKEHNSSDTESESEDDQEQDSTEKEEKTELIQGGRQYCCCTIILLLAMATIVTQNIILDNNLFRNTGEYIFLPAFKG